MLKTSSALYFSHFMINILKQWSDISKFSRRNFCNKENVWHQYHLYLNEIQLCAWFSILKWARKYLIVTLLERWASQLFSKDLMEGTFEEYYTLFKFILIIFICYHNKIHFSMFISHEYKTQNKLKTCSILTASWVSCLILSHVYSPN